jgi:UPF0271 protein
MRVDLNADVGEGGQEDAELLRYVTSANIACGAHAGDSATMRRTVEPARDLGVAVGAHPGFDDRDGFGRREMRLSTIDVASLVRQQLETLAAVATAGGVRLQHVKPHGALYNMAARDERLAAAIADTVKAFDPDVILLGLAGSALVAAARSVGLRAAGEGFADRGYLPDGSLIPRGRNGAVIDNPSEAIAQALRLVRASAATATGTPPRIDSLCIHGDTPGAASLAALLRSALIDAGVEVEPLGAADR